MSTLRTERDKLKTKLESKLDPSFNIYTQIEEDGYKSPYIVIAPYYGISSPSSDARSKQARAKFDLLLGIDYGKRETGETQEEFLETELEKLFDLSYYIEEGDISIYDDQNKNGNNTKACEITLKK